MITLPIVQGSFVIERDYAATAAEVFEAWSDIDLKARWFIGPEGWSALRRELDLRVGGTEILHGRLPNGTETLFTARYHEVVPDRCLVYVYDMHLDGRHHSTSLATVELRPKGSVVQLVFTEHVAFLDGTKDASGRERGTAAHLDRLTRCLARGSG